MASFSETVICGYSPEVKWGICSSVLRYNGYEIKYSDESELCGVKGINAVKIWLKISSLGVEVMCKGTLESWCKKQVDRFVKIMNAELGAFTSKREEQYLKVTKEYMPTLGYNVPDRLPEPFPEETPNLFYPLVAALLVTGASISLFSLLWSSTSENWSIPVLWATGPALGYMIRYAVVAGDFYNWKLLRILLVVCCLTVGVVGFYIAETRGFFEHRTTGSMIFLVAGFFVIPSLIGLGIMKEGRQKVQKNSVPEETLIFIRFFHLKNYPEGMTRLELTRRGWNNAKDQDKVFEALRSYLEMQSALKIHWEKQ